MKIKYEQEMRDMAKAEGRHLVTVDIPGMSYQGTCTTEQRRELIQLLTRWIKTDTKTEGK
jgi:cell division protein ZapA (FtsZ GTPase activity inhibitor)